VKVQLISKKKVQYFFLLVIPIIFFSYTYFPEAEAGIDDSLVDYLRIEFYIIYAENKETSANKFVADSDLEKVKHLYKDENSPKKLTMIEKGTTQHEVSGFLTFLNDDDAVEYFSIMSGKLLSKDVVYAKLFLFGNNHHAPDDIVHADIVWLETTHGDTNEVNWD